MTETEFLAELQRIGEERYHHKHPFHLRMHEGKLSRGQLQVWALNRYYYQSRIPIKDAVILSRSDDPEFRRAWRKRIVDHDGSTGSVNEPSPDVAVRGAAGGSAGGIEKWLKLVEVTGGSREQAIRGEGVLPAVRYAVDAYVHFVSTKSLVEAVASSLTELFAGSLIALRMGALRQHYPWMEHGLSYFEARVTQASADAQFALSWVYRNARTVEEQELACNALRAKCDLLWAQLDALYFSYVQPGWPPPGALRLKEQG
jgi:pyrroloquinoline quinone (PQQ) biosynthesis protein C